MNRRENYRDIRITDFSDPSFQRAFQQYFWELGIQVRDWEGLFQEMNGEEDNEAYVRLCEDGEVIGFILFQPIRFSSWFFEETAGFIREFWIKEACRSHGHGSEMLALAEARLAAQGIHTIVLTTDTAEEFYLDRGYQKTPGMKAKNEDPVYIKRI